MSSLVEGLLQQIVVMGVSGSGKSTVAAGLASELGLRMVDGDDLHLPESVTKMRAGIALEDADRWPWLDRIGHYLVEDGDQPAQGRIVACSALKRTYRDRIRRLAPTVRFIFLDGEPELIRDRMSRRKGHYMQPGLLASQLHTLERPQADETDVIKLDIQVPPAELVALAMRALVVGQALASA
jgi:carbohydrate kinase (thermoresistant glucokinase family)